MSDIATAERDQTVAGLGRAVHQHRFLSREGVLERLFTLAFRGLVYAQIWEDPVVDMLALEIKPDDHVVTIASGGCNALSYLVANPGKVTAVDLNHAHIALLRLKIEGARRLPTQRAFHDFFARADRPGNVEAFDRWIAPHLDRTAHRYWTRRDALARRRISAFERGFFRTGLLGRFIAAGHVLARLHGVRLDEVTRAATLDEQRAVFATRLDPIFERSLIKWLLQGPASLFGLGIPPQQYEALAGSEPGGIATVLRRRLRKLACGCAAKDNYFAWQAFERRYDPDENGSVPPYLEERNFEAMRARVARIDPRHGSMTDVLRSFADGSVDCFVLLDAQDWMTTTDLTQLWIQIDRTARFGARVIFRTAADERLLPGRIPAAILDRWHYEAGVSRDLHERDRSSIYGAFHLYRRIAA